MFDIFKKLLDGHATVCHAPIVGFFNNSREFICRKFSFVILFPHSVKFSFLRALSPILLNFHRIVNILSEFEFCIFCVNERHVTTGTVLLVFWDQKNRPRGFYIYSLSSIIFSTILVFFHLGLKKM
jgi:hypothetical protein